MSPDLLRILDANANRAREALRVLEDYARFAVDDAPLTTELKNLRHDFAAALAALPMDRALLARDTPSDVGVSIKTPAELHRESPAHILAANAKRLSEALRSMEESAKLLNPAAAAALESLRYRGYTLEQRIVTRAHLRSAAERFREVRLYILLTESLCPDCPLTWERTLDAILGAVAQPGGFPPSSLCIQLREKEISDARLLERAKVLSQRCRQAGVLSIINDRPDIALLAQADGIHLGQTDLPPAAARALLGPQAILGISTENLDQARAAAQTGAATYLALGPMFPTTTKHKPRIAGPAYADQARATFPDLPLVAIGGITPANLPQLTALGVRCVAVSSAILRASDPAAAISEFLALLAPAAPPSSATR
jgi:thiamine-phosphate pyrophosphorylase